ncbi:MAG TPA: HU family DNA-binding protein [bacterium]|jgi:integration host factor subunit beta|nr:HU family DNA-binding protein [bacterium]
MNRSELILKFSEFANIPKKKAETIVDTVFGEMKNALDGGDRIELRGFGSFVNKEYGSYTGRNPKTGESITVPPKRLPFFKVGKELKEELEPVKNS